MLKLFRSVYIGNGGWTFVARALENDRCQACMGHGTRTLHRQGGSTTSSFCDRRSAFKQNAVKCFSGVGSHACLAGCYSRIDGASVGNARYRATCNLGMALPVNAGSSREGGQRVRGSERGDEVGRRCKVACVKFFPSGKVLTRFRAAPWGASVVASCPPPLKRHWRSHFHSPHSTTREINVCVRADEGGGRFLRHGNTWLGLESLGWPQLMGLQLTDAHKHSSGRDESSVFASS
ncbi:hypothetical protein B0I35DRAFT_252308 [Stachybotrys elegans]|uniref:Uncharacterized protein n=1 Tax=Stachybotrys elegans TaxID=80388 RepID=A0A8K0SSC5_9HYPO|nr:hypothetical protein B0I35DRAFT_252308 [Stachybotrys elegans]